MIKALTYKNISEADRKAFDSKLKTAAYPPDIYKVLEAPAVELKNSSLFKKLRGRFG